MVAEMMAEDDALLERKRAELAPIRARFEALYHELHPDKSCPQYGSTLPVLQALRMYVDEHKKLKEEHEKLLEREPDLRREERQLCNELNERSLQIDNPNFLTKQLVAQMSLLSEHIKELRQEKVLRLFSFRTNGCFSFRSFRPNVLIIYLIFSDRYMNSKKFTDGNDQPLKRWLHVY